MTQPLLSIDNLTVGFRREENVRTVVNDVSLTVNAGETLALVGESGSGKSVTALSILRLLPSPRRFIFPATSAFTASLCFTPTKRRCAACAATGSR